MESTFEKINVKIDKLSLMLDVVKELHSIGLLGRCGPRGAPAYFCIGRFKAHRAGRGQLCNVCTWQSSGGDGGGGVGGSHWITWPTSINSRAHWNNSRGEAHKRRARGAYYIHNARAPAIIISIIRNRVFIDLLYMRAAAYVNTRTTLSAKRILPVALLRESLCLIRSIRSVCFRYSATVVLSGAL